MPYDLPIAIDLGAAYSGLTDLRAQLRDAAGASVGAEIPITSERPGGNGLYYFSVPAVPDGHVGWVDIYQSTAPSIVIFFVGVEPPASGAIDVSAIEIVTDRLDAMIENAGGYDRWLATALELVPPATVAASDIHAALDTWSYQGEEASPPMVLPPADASLCSIYAWFGKYGTLDPEKMTAKIVQLPYKAYGRYWPGKEETFTMDPENPGSAYCHMPVGAEVLVVFSECGFRSRFEIPDTATHEI